MKKNRVAFFIFLILAIPTAYFIFTKSGSTIEEELRDFSVSDTGLVDKIFLADKSGNQVILERKSETEWTVNGKNQARPDAINLLLATLKSMEVQSPVGKAARNNIIREMSAKGVKVEIYQNQKLYKTFYVGGATQDQLGTYMYLQNSTIPFIIHIPGFDGYLSPRFIVNAADWKFKSVFGYKRGELNAVVVENFSHPDQSFELRKDKSQVYSLYKYPSGELQNYFDTAFIQSYLANYQFVNYEKPLTSMEKQSIDSVLTIGPIMNIITTHTNGSKINIELYVKPADKNYSGHWDETGKLLPFDPDRLIGRINKDTALVLVQYFSFGKLMVTLDEIKNPVKKRK